MVSGMSGQPPRRMIEPDTLAPPPDESHEPVVRAKSAALLTKQIQAGYVANHAAQSKLWQQAQKELDDWNEPAVRRAHLTKWWQGIDRKCRSEIAKDGAKRGRQRAELEERLARAREDVFFGDCEEGVVLRLEERILAQRAEEAQRAEDYCEKRELSIARVEHFAGLRQESIQGLEKEIAKHELKGNANKVRTLKNALAQEIGPDPLAVAKKAAIAEARRSWSAGAVYVPFAVKSPARVGLEAYLNEVVRVARAEILRYRTAPPGRDPPWTPN